MLWLSHQCSKVHEAKAHHSCTCLVHVNKREHDQLSYKDNKISLLYPKEEDIGQTKNEYFIVMVI